MISDDKHELVKEGTMLWQPSEKWLKEANITRYLGWLKENRGLDFSTYSDLWDWSVTDLEAFWQSIYEYFGVKSRTPYSEVLNWRKMPGARWFIGAEVNYAEHALTRRDDHPAVVFKAEGQTPVSITYGQLYRRVAAVAASLRRMGVGRGDTVVGYMTNIPETLIAFLATASIGATWSVCPPEFGVRNTVDRFRQTQPTVLFAVEGYRYNGRYYDRLDWVKDIQQQLPSLKHTVLVPHPDGRLSAMAQGDAVRWDGLVRDEVEEIVFEPVPFNHPLWVIYSSGTTGLPKAIVQSHGGILVEFLKIFGLQFDLKPEDRFLWFTTTGWMVWSFNTGVLPFGATMVMADGSAVYPDYRALWQLVAETGVTIYGASAPYIQVCMREGFSPRGELDLGPLRMIHASASPMSPEAFAWIYTHVKEDVLVASGSGGTDICSGITGPCPLLPVYAGEMQCRCLGAKAEAFNEQGRPVIDEVGELVLTEPMPSMPLYLLGDADGSRYRESYFETFPGVWQHGDWFKVTSRGTCQVYGRSDSTLKRGGIRMGTSEYYRVVESMPEIADSLVIDTSMLGVEGRILLFVVLREGLVLDDELKAVIKERLRNELSPRHVPDEIHAIAEVPRTLNQKKLEVPVRRVLTGTPVARAVNLDSLANPESFEWFVEFAAKRVNG